jgi:hypothetical protein
VVEKEIHSAFSSTGKASLDDLSPVKKLIAIFEDY